MTAFSRALCATTLLSTLAPAAAFASAPEITPPIIISATRSATPINQIASSVSVITSQDIERKNKSTVTELLREVPGITIANNGGVGQPTSLFMRGTESRHVLVVLDGVVLNDPSDPSDRFDFSNLTTDNIERIEVLRGPQSTLYGTQAIGGVINIVSKQGKGAPKANALAEYGSYNSRKLSAGSSGEIGRTAYSFQLGNTHTGGRSSLSRPNGGFEADGNDTTAFVANLASKLTEKFTAKLATRYNRTYTESDSPGVFSFIAPRPADDPEAHTLTRQFNGRAAGELSLFDGVWVQEVGVSMLNVNRDSITSYYDDTIFDSPFGRQVFIGDRRQIDWIHHIKAAPNHTITFGTENRKDSFRTDKRGENDVSSQGYFIDDQLSVGDAFIGSGARIDDHQTFGRQFTWKIAPGYHIRPTGTTLKFTYGTGFKAPSLADLYTPGTGNPALLPEKSRGWDMGFEQALWGDRLTFGSTFFRNDITNMLGNAPTYPFMSINVGKARTEGVENTVTLRPAVDWTARASYVYTLSQDRLQDKDLLRRPRHQGNAELVYDYSLQGDVGMNVRYESARRDGDIVTFAPVYAKSFTTVELNTNYRLNPNVTLYARVENLLNKQYEEVAGYSQPGLSAYGGVKWGY